MPLDPNKRNPRHTPLPGSGLPPSAPPEPAAEPKVPVRPAALMSAPNVFALLNALRRRWLLAVGCGFALAVLAATATWFFPGLTPSTVYSQVRISSSPTNLVFQPNEILDFEKYQKVQSALVKRPSALEAAVAALREQDADLLAQQSDPVSWLERQLVIEFGANPEMMKITLKGSRPAELLPVVQAVAEAYVKESNRLETEERKTRLQQLEAALAKQETELHARQNDFEKELNQVEDGKPAPAAARAPLTAEQRAEAEKQLFQTQTELARLQPDVAARQKKIKEGTDLPLSEALIEDQIEQRFEKEPTYADQQKQLIKLEEQIAELKRVAVDAEARAMPLRRQQEAIMASQAARHKQLRESVVKALQEKARTDHQAETAQLVERLTSLQAQETLLTEKLKAPVQESGGAPKLPLPLEWKRAEIAKLEAIVKQASERAQKMRFELDAPPRVQLQQKATAMPRDATRQMQLAGLMGLGAFASTLFGFALWEFRSRRVSSVDEVSQGLGIRLLGSLPRLPDRVRRQFVEPAAVKDFHRHNQLNESIDVTRTILIHAAQAEALQTVMVTSASEGEGKTSLASHLSASLARAGHKTLLIDCDLRKPAAHRLFNLPLEPGFSELLRAEVHLADVIRPTRLNRLWMVPAGICDSHATQALAQETVENIFEELRGQFDFIVLDTCPVLPVADALLLGQHVDGVIFSILRDESRLPKVYAAYQRMASLGCKMLGAVVHGTASDSYSSEYQQVMQPTPTAS
jgi:succinoglycan biosynthesis transport protein ExoP